MESDEYRFTPETTVEIDEATLTKEELRWLSDAGLVHRRQSSDGEVKHIQLDIKKLAQIAFEYENLITVASSVETDVMAVFRKRSDNVLTTSQIAEYSGRPKSSVSRALGRLVDKGKISKVQSGVYRY
jgi:predicted transcriptional regulator